MIRTQPFSVTGHEALPLPACLPYHAVARSCSKWSASSSALVRCVALRCRRATPASAGVFVAQLIDQCIGHDGAAPGKRTEAVDRPGRGASRRFGCRRQGAARKLRDDLARGLFLPTGAFLGGLQDVVGDIKRGAHASDAMALRFGSQSPNVRPDIRPDIRPDVRPSVRPNVRSRSPGPWRRCRSRRMYGVIQIEPPIERRRVHLHATPAAPSRRSLPEPGRASANASARSGSAQRASDRTDRDGVAAGGHIRCCDGR